MSQLQKFTVHCECCASRYILLTNVDSEDDPQYCSMCGSLLPTAGDEEGED